jgi:hypothetical protein
MFSVTRLLFPRLHVLAAGDLARFPDKPKILGQNEEESLRMNNEGCPTDTPIVDDATGYSKEEDEANPINCDEVL